MPYEQIDSKDLTGEPMQMYIALQHYATDWLKFYLPYRPFDLDVRVYYYGGDKYIFELVVETRSEIFSLFYSLTALEQAIDINLMLGANLRPFCNDINNSNRT